MENIRIQDDLFHAVNQEWINQAVIPDDRPTTGGFSLLSEEVEKTLIRDLNEMCSAGEFENASLKYACALYTLIKDTKKRNRAKMRPIAKRLNKIAALSGMTALNRNLKEFVLNNFPLPFNIGVEEDMKNSSRRWVVIYDAGTILPDASFYRPGKEAQKQQMLELWTKMARMILAESTLSPEDQERYVADTIRFDDALGSLTLSNEELSDYATLYHPMKTRTVSGYLKPFKFRKLLTDLFGFAPDEIEIVNPNLIKNFGKVFNEDKLEEYKHWAYVRLLLGSTPLLSEHLRDLGGMFGRALSGVQKATTPEKHAYQLVSRIYSEPLGIYYGKKYFGDEARKDTAAIVYSIIDQYQKRIKNNDFLSEATKEKAILKLSKIIVNTGYPDEARPFYQKLVFDETDNLPEAYAKLRRISLEYAFSRLTQPVDRTEWAMPGHMVNACYDPFKNTITFPAAILQPPFYSIRQTRSQNLGGIGAVIAHEISHAFDNNGAKFDETGSLNNWWTKEDFKNFNARTKAMVKEFDGIELPWGKVNGKFIVSENIADNGGMAVTLDIMKHTPNASYEEYFINWARIWCIKAKPEYQQLLLSLDVHAPAILRANMQPRNFEEWYDTFHVTSKDQMYLAPNKRVTIW